MPRWNGHEDIEEDIEEDIAAALKASAMVGHKHVALNGVMETGSLDGVVSRGENIITRNVEGLLEGPSLMAELRTAVGLAGLARKSGGAADDQLSSTVGIPSTSKAFGSP